MGRNSGTRFDSNLNLQEHTHKTCKSRFFYLYNIERIRKYLSQECTNDKNECTRILVQDFIIGRIDYCKGLLFGLPSVHRRKLQRLQNAAPRLISNVPRYSQKALVLSSLHWLPVNFPTDLKILLVTFKAIYGHSPRYLIDLITIKEQPWYNLGSARGLKKTLEDLALSCAAPNLWNNLPLHIRLENSFERFKSFLKTHHFRLALICNVFNLLCNIFSVFIFISVVYF